MLSAGGWGTGTCRAAQAHTRVHTPPRCAHTSTPRTCTESSVSRVLGAGVHTRTPRHVHPRVWGTAPAPSPHWGGHTAVTLAGHMPPHTHGPRAVTHAHPQPAALCTHPECDGAETPPAHACTCTRVCGHTPILPWGGASLAGLPPHTSAVLPAPLRDGEWGLRDAEWGLRDAEQGLPDTEQALPRLQSWPQPWGLAAFLRRGLELGVSPTCLGLAPQSLGVEPGWAAGGEPAQAGLLLLAGRAHVPRHGVARDVPGIAPGLTEMGSPWGRPPAWGQLCVGGL